MILPDIAACEQLDKVARVYMPWASFITLIIIDNNTPGHSSRSAFEAAIRWY